MDNQTIVLLCASVAVALIGYIVAQFVLNRGAGERLRSRLKGGGIDTARPGKPTPKVKEFVQNLGQHAARPFMTDDANKQVVIRKGLARAGIYSPSAARMVTGAKVICLCVGFVLGWVVGVYLDQFMFGISIGGIGGYIAPVIWLKFRTAKNQKQLTNGLADTLDLMVVCIESGLTIDAAMQRVGQELVMAHPAIGREFGLAHMETRVGLTRTEALKNMGQRTGNKALQSLASMLIQAERFGTSIADALRVHSESLRINRQMAAEEAAGKASVKMSFPLVLCIFPATFIVLAGPTIIQLVQSSLFN
jgi:tight adherence protein C